MERPEPLLTISPWRVTRLLLLLVAGLTLASAGGSWAVHRGGVDPTHVLVELFDLNEEQNIPTWAASSMLLAAAGLFGAAAAAALTHRQRGGAHWGVLSLLFVYFSLDEAVSLHERLIGPLRAWLGATGVFHYAWVIPYAGLVVLIGLAYRNFLRALHPATRHGLLAAAALYVSGAMGMEMVSGAYISAGNQKDFVYAGMTLVEELLEMLGVVVLLHALLCYMGVHGPAVRAASLGAHAPGE